MSNSSDLQPSGPLCDGASLSERVQEVLRNYRVESQRIQEKRDYSAKLGRQVAETEKEMVALKNRLDSQKYRISSALSKEELQAIRTQTVEMERALADSEQLNKNLSTALSRVNSEIQAHNNRLIHEQRTLETPVWEAYLQDLLDAFMAANQDQLTAIFAAAGKARGNTVMVFGDRFAALHNKEKCAAVQQTQAESLGLDQV
jgi:septal ring factor EnvC (AmiA/AmiB activator)